MEIELKSPEELISKLKGVRLRGSLVLPYLDSRIDLITLMPTELSPCQRYALVDDLKKVESLRWEILEKSNIDILRLNGYIKCKYDGEAVITTIDNEHRRRTGQTEIPCYQMIKEPQIIDIIPIVCEEFITPDYKLKIKINDGLHRAYLAYEMGVPVTVAYIRGVHPEYPYYSHIIPEGWAGVELIQTIREGYIKKFHTAKEYKSLFRNFNSSFENIGDSRPYEKKGE